MSIWMWIFVLIMAFFFVCGIWWGFKVDIASPVYWTCCLAACSTGYMIGTGAKIIVDIIKDNL